MSVDVKALCCQQMWGRELEKEEGENQTDQTNYAEAE